MPAVNDSLREWAAFVRAAVCEREDLVIEGSEYGDVTVQALHHARAQTGNVIKRANTRPGLCFHL